METNEKPIIFSTEMVKAILDGRKTQTRRVAKFDFYAGHEDKFYYKPVYYTNICSYVLSDIDRNAIVTFELKPRYKPGDIIWVRETWGYAKNNLHPEKSISGGMILYKETDDSDDVEKWRPSIHMPKTAARIFLRVTDVRVERLKDISEADAIAEGCEKILRKTDLTVAAFARNSFAILWDSINAKRDGGAYKWDMNPWVWVISFERIADYV